MLYFSYLCIKRWIGSHPKVKPIEQKRVMANKGAINLARPLFRAFCKVYGKIISLSVVIQS